MDKNGCYGDPVGNLSAQINFLRFLDESYREIITKLYPLDSKEGKNQLEVMKWTYKKAYRYTIFRLIFNFFASKVAKAFLCSNF